MFFLPLGDDYYLATTFKYEGLITALNTMNGSKNNADLTLMSLTIVIPRSHWQPGRSLTANRKQFMSLLTKHAQQWRET